MRIEYPTNPKNFFRVIHENWSVWFSYETSIAIVIDNQVFISKNEWAQTTGKHLNYIAKQYEGQTVIISKKELDEIISDNIW